MLTQAELKRHLHYDPDTGIFIRLMSKAYNSNIGKPPGVSLPDGSLRISVNNKTYPAHRLAWLYMTGEFPDFYLTHINRIKSDNRWLNIRKEYLNRDKFSTINQDKLKKILNYDPDTGIFTWINPIAHTTKIGDIANSINHYGYIVISIYRRRYLAHRLAWLYVNGEFPIGAIDHINGDRSDNVFINLRIATPQQNLQNTGISKANTSGYKGVSFCKKTKKWSAQATVNYKTIHIGKFETREQASEAYVSFIRPIHGEFYREVNNARS